MDLDLAAVVDIAERAGRLQVQRRPSLVVKGTKAHVNDLVSDVDLASEQLIGDALSALWPDDGILGEAPIEVSGAALAEAVVGLSFNPSPATKEQVADMIGRMLPAIGDLRRLPAALDLAYLAAGRLDAAVLVDTKPWDVAAGLLIAVEAGARYGSEDPARLVLA